MTAPAVRPAWCNPDHPCGSLPSFENGCRGDSCRLMYVLHSKGMRNVPVPESRSTYRDAEPYARIVRALVRQGHEFDDLAGRCGLAPSSLRHLAFGITQRIQPNTAKAIGLLLELLPSETVSA